MIILEDIALRRGPKLLMQGASTTLQPGQKLALIGANGTGKSSLFAMLLGELSADQGQIRGMTGLRVAHMAQELEVSDDTTINFVMAGDAAVYRLTQNIAKAEQAEDYERAAYLYQEMEVLDGYSAPRRAEQLLLGLGFTQPDLQASVTEFSGGWRVRLNLARALMTPSDVLLLDEPTNHLDLDTMLWLQGWLLRYSGTLLMISHDRDFIDAICERTLSLEQEQLIPYRGGYSAYEQQRAERMAQQRAQYAKQQREIGQMEDFVRRFRAKATKARQAQSRLKALERMETVAPAHVDSPFSFQFPEPGKSSDPLLTIDNLVLGYGDDVIIDGVSLSLHPGDRIGLLGKNGAGKSTFLKGLTGALPALSGDRVTGAHLRIGYFDQQQLEVLDLQASALLHLQRLSPKVREQTILDFLGGFNFKGDRARQEIAPFSGGEKARLALAMVVWQDPNVLILDEPTNHLDLEMRHALAVALQGYTGAIVLVSHDRHLMRHAVESLWLVDNGAVTEYPDDLTAYEQWVLSGDRTAAVNSDKAAKKTALTQDGGGQSKQNRQGAAEQRARLRPLQKALEKTERTLEGSQQKLGELQAQLANSDLYEPDQHDQLAQLVEQEGLLKAQLGELEETWMQQQEAIENASG
ncbi:ABC-F family ATP-binding cassette domain-containing protein [Luminiphilus sp. nBUS_07]|uniref:ABC-F family ATP-binding cassette domain-containing protein n=1 Tax=Luminiphilus sp. nBUS_07 TaxID=3395314 RepID=UPI003EBE84FF